MEKGKFDDLAKGLGKAGTRRLILQGLGSSALGLFAASLLGADEVDAKKKNRKNRRRRRGGGGGGGGGGGDASVVNNLGAVGVDVGGNCAGGCPASTTCRNNTCCPTTASCSALGAAFCGPIAVPGCGEPVQCGCTAPATCQNGVCVAPGQARPPGQPCAVSAQCTADGDTQASVCCAFTASATGGPPTSGQFPDAFCVDSGTVDLARATCAAAGGAVVEACGPGDPCGGNAICCANVVGGSVGTCRQLAVECQFGLVGTQNVGTTTTTTTKKP